MLNVFLLVWTPRALASVETYDAAVEADFAVPVARLTTPQTFTGANRASFNFGATSGDVTMEFIVEGDPVASGASSYLAVGANTASNLRFGQWNNTGQLGFTQLGVADYLFSPAVPSPNVPVHLAYVWEASTATMALYLNGTFAGSRSGVSQDFSMPTGQGFLGANPSGTEAMVGTVYRVTVYDEILPDASILIHADAFNEVIRLPLIVSFTASPEAIFSPTSSLLTWEVLDASAIFLNGMDVSGLSSLSVTPAATTTYILTATNEGGAATAQTIVQVDPAPVVHRFGASRRFVGSGAPVTLSWDVSFGDTISISPEVGDVTGMTVNGLGSVVVHPLSAVTYTLTAGSRFGMAASEVTVEVVRSAEHLVISEFMADNESTLLDEDGDSSDWIEVYNPTLTAVDLAGHFLTDDDDDPLQWPFPSLHLAPGGYLVVFASGKDRRDPGGELHANFGLNTGGEYVALVGPGPVLLHGIEFSSQRADISYGILGGDVSVEQFMGHPTPGAANDEQVPPPAAVEFSMPSGFFVDAFDVVLTTRTPDALIRYTVDGSMPDLDHGVTYTEAVQVAQTARLRAVAVLGDQASRLADESYVKLGSDVEGYESSLPILVIENFGAGEIPQKGWSGTGAGVRQLPRQDAVWATFDRVAGVSSLTNRPQMMSSIGIRGRGAFSTTWRQRPYSVEAVNAQGEERDVSPLGLPEHSDWVLYFPDPDTNKDPSLLFNTFAYELSRNTGRYSVRFRWVEVFVNEDGGDLSLEDRRGVYAIIEKVSRGADRLDFERLSADGTTGSWLLNINRMDPEPEGGWPAPNGATQPWFFHTAGPDRLLQTPPNTPSVGDDIPRQSNGYLNFDNPSGYSINTAQRAAIENWFVRFEDVLYDDAVWRDPVNGYRQYLDPLDFVDYFILNVLTRNGDGLLISMFPWKGDDGKLRMGPAWDYNWSAYYISGGPTGSLTHRSDRLWYPRLFADPDFAQLYIDRWWELRAGPMSNAAIEAIIDGQAADISPEKALLNGLPSEADWAARLTEMKNWLTTRADWIDSNYIRPPVFNRNGGAVAEGFHLVVSGTNGTVYVSIDGTDPRAPDGGVAASAQIYQEPIPILDPATVKARIRNGSDWSGLASAVFYPPHVLTGLVLSEIMFNPVPFEGWSGSDLEFLELKNVGALPLNLGNVAFTAGVEFTFPNGTLLGPGQFFVLVRNPAAFVSRGVAVDGVYSGGLGNSGDTVRLSTPTGVTVLSVDYHDRAPWPIAADGYGFSMVPDGSVFNSDNGSNWRASAAPGGSPGADDPAVNRPGVVINEILTHTDLPAVDVIELSNPTGAAADIGGWFLSDDATVPKKFRIPPGTMIPAGGYHLFTEADFNPVPGTLLNFSLDSGGDELYLSAGDAWTNLTGYSHGLSFEAAANGVTFGRYVNSVGEEQFPSQVTETFGSVNSGPRVGAVVIQEILYHPDPANEEFIELRNVSGEDVELFDSVHPTNTWRINGAGYNFPPHITIRAGEVLLVVGTDPTAFRAKHGVPAEVQVLGPFGGNLQDSGERLALQRPDSPDTNGVAYITVDAVRYNDKPPWPPAADGSGPSLQRIVVAEYGDDPGNWVAALPTPGLGRASGESPVVTLHPQSQTIVAYQTAIFTVSALGPANRYQWLYAGTAIIGATASSLVLETVQPRQIGDYSVVVYNAFGSALSEPAQLSIRFPALVLSQPRAVITSQGSTATFAVSALGTGPLSYQWRFKSVELVGETGATLIVTEVGAEDDGDYTVVITDNVGPVSSAPARLTVLFKPETVQAPLSQTHYVGDSVTFSIVTRGTLPMGYRWRNGGVTVASRVLDAHVDFLTLTNLTLANGGRYSVVLTNQALFLPGSLSPAAVLTVLEKIDTDGDGLPDDYENANGLDPTDGSDARLDPDGDGMSSADEFVAGTNPQDALSVLRVKIDVMTGAVTLQFFAVESKTYAVQFRDGAGEGPWQLLRVIPAKAVSGDVEVIDGEAPGPGERYYRLVTPVLVGE